MTGVQTCALPIFLGAYQAVIYEALHEAGIEPDWTVGASLAVDGGCTAH